MQMQNKKKLWQKWVGHLLVLLLLMTQSSALWARMTPPSPAHQVMTKDCARMIQLEIARHSTCQDSCCQQLKQCSVSCFTQCTATVLNTIPASHPMLIPHFYLNAVSDFQTSVPAGQGIAVLHRPPRQYT